MNPTELSRQLRHRHDAFMPQRRKVVALSLISAGSMALIALYQIGSIRHLPEPPLPYLDADKVDASDEAYARFSTPDAFLGLVSFGVTALLAAMGEPGRAISRPLLPMALAVKSGFDTVQAAILTKDQWTRHKAFCFWCLVAASATFAALPAALSESRAIFQGWRRSP